MKDDGTIDDQEMFVLREECAKKVGFNLQELQRLIEVEKTKHLKRKPGFPPMTPIRSSGKGKVALGFLVSCIVVGGALLAWVNSGTSSPPPENEESQSTIPEPVVQDPSPDQVETALPIANELSDLLNKADQFRSSNKFREAELLLTRAVQLDSNDLESWRKLGDTQLRMAQQAIADFKLLSAGQLVDRAAITLNKVKSIVIDPELGQIDPEVVMDEERAFSTVANELRHAVDVQLQTNIEKAKACAEAASHSKWNVLALGLRSVKNDRDKVVEELKHLSSVFELSPWGSAETKIQAIIAMSDLKKLVYDEEWVDLKSRAGFAVDAAFESSAMKSQS